MISGIFLSGVKVIALHLQDYLPEHAIPALEGGIIERVGRKSDTIEIHGFLYSGSDTDKTTLQGLVGFMKTLDVPSTFNLYYAIHGDIEIDRIDFIQPAGKQYPYYEYVVRATFPASGEVLFTNSGVSGRAGGIIVGVLAEALSGKFIFNGAVNYSQVLPIFASIHPDYSQVLPVGISIHPDYSQVLPIGITEHPDYTQVLPLGASIHANYVRIS